MFRDIACLLAYDLSGVIINSTDSIFISAFVGTVEVAIIGNYTLIINSISQVIAMVLNAARPSIGNLAVTSSIEKQKLVFNRINFITFYLTCIFMTCLFVLLTPFITEIWFNKNYAISILLVIVLCINFFIDSMIRPIASFRVANGIFVQGWLRPIITAALNIILDVLLGYNFGILGILIATIVSRLVTQVWFDPYLVFKLVFKEKPFEYCSDPLKLDSKA